MSNGQAKKSHKPHIVWFTLSTANFRMVGCSCLPQQLNFLSNHLTRFKKTAKEFTSIAQIQRNTRRIANKFVTVAGSIWGSFQGWGSFRGLYMSHFVSRTFIVFTDAKDKRFTHTCNFFVILLSKVHKERQN